MPTPTLEETVQNIKNAVALMSGSSATEIIEWVEHIDEGGRPWDICVIYKYGTFIFEATPIDTDLIRRTYTHRAWTTLALDFVTFRRRIIEWRNEQEVNILHWLSNARKLYNEPYVFAVFRVEHVLIDLSEQETYPLFGWRIITGDRWKSLVEKALEHQDRIEVIPHVRLQDGIDYLLSIKVDHLPADARYVLEWVGQAFPIVRGTFPLIDE